MPVAHRVVSDSHDFANEHGVNVYEGLGFMSRSFSRIAIHCWFYPLRDLVVKIVPDKPLVLLELGDGIVE